MMTGNGRQPVRKRVPAMNAEIHPNAQAAPPGSWPAVKSGFRELTWTHLLDNLPDAELRHPILCRWPCWEGYQWRFSYDLGETPLIIGLLRPNGRMSMTFYHPNGQLLHSFRCLLKVSKPGQFADLFADLAERFCSKLAAHLRTYTRKD